MAPEGGAVQNHFCISCDTGYEIVCTGRDGRGKGGGGRGKRGGGRVEGVRGKRGGRGRRSKFISPQTCTILYDCEFPVLNIILTFPFDQLTLRDYQQPLFLCESFAVSGNLIGAEQIPTDRGTVG